jgi:predicted GIY-YIG superfamily endonuclease
MIEWSKSSFRLEFLYIFRAANGLYKIGKSKNPAQRLQAFKSGPIEVTLIWQQEFPDAASAERQAHHYFKKQRVRGEWFDLESEQVDPY